MHKELRYWLALLRVPGLGSAKAQLLIEHFGSLTAFFALSASQWRAEGVPETFIESLTNMNWELIDRDLAWAEQTDQHIICIDDPVYPPLLREILTAPMALFIKGDLNKLTLPQLAIVGSRNPTPAGIEIANNFAAALASVGYTITSGLALGIDAASHRGALQAKGQTIAVLGASMDHIYPRRHRKLATQICQNGALVSEFFLDTQPRADHFPRRNRIISGLSLGVLVVEANIRSGSLITARYANEQCREVFAIPGSIHNPLAKGCHYLLSQGAKLVENIEDIINELPPLAELNNDVKILSKEVTTQETMSRGERKLLACIDYGLTSTTQIIKRSGLTATVVSSMLVALELQGAIKAIHGGYCRIKGSQS